MPMLKRMLSENDYTTLASVSESLGKESVSCKEKFTLKEKLVGKAQFLNRFAAKTPRNNRSVLELRSVLKQISDQVSTEEFTAVSLLTAALIGRISAAINRLSDKELQEDSLFTGSLAVMDDFSCPRCHELLYNPVTLPCGHTFCQTCISDTPMHRCAVCNKPSLQEGVRVYRPNVVLLNAIQAWHPMEWGGRSYTVKGKLLLSREQYQDAVNVFSEALRLSPDSHMALLHRAKSYYFLNLLDLALEDAVRTCQIAPTWPEAYYVKGEILYKLGCCEESMIAFLVSMVLDPKKNCARRKVMMLLAQVLQTGSMKDCEGAHDASGNRSPNSRKRSHATSCYPNKVHCDNPTTNSSVFGVNREATRDVTLMETFFEEGNRRNDFYEQVEHDDFGNTSGPTESCEMSSCRTHSHFPVELPCEKIRMLLEETPVLDEKGNIIPSDLPRELENKVDEILFNAENIITRDLTLLCNTSHNKEVDDLKREQINATRPKRKVDPTLVEPKDFECSLCMRLFYNPVCTPCGHTFCQFCVERCLDHSPSCPLCKQSIRRDLNQSADSRDRLHPTCDYVTKAIIHKYLAVQHKERQQQHEQEIAQLNQSQPIFVCTIAYPSVPCPLHIFEPRYRLMLRRCLEHNEREFGMCMPMPGKPHHQIGTLLKVRDVSFFQDGRSLVDSIGFRRFRTSDCQVQDGYNVAKISYIVDVNVADVQEMESLLQQVYNEGTTWLTSLPAGTQSQISKYFGDFPVQDYGINTENGPDWLWWLLAVLPVEDRVKATILGKDSLSDRLTLFQKIFKILRKRNEST